MKNPLLWIVLLAALVIIGCGGGGGGGTDGGSDGGTGDIVFALSLSPSAVVGGRQNSVGTVTLAENAPSGGFNVTLSSSDPVATVPGSVSVTEGQKTATFTITTSAVSTTRTVSITGSHGTRQDTAQLEVRRVTIRTGVYGTVQDTTGQGLAGAKVKFYNAGGAFIKEVTTNSGGAFEAELPTTAKQFTVDISGVSGASNYFNQYGYKDDDYLADETGCLAPLPTFAEGQAVSLATPLVFMPRWMGPPPPPTGCLNGGG